VVESPRHVKAPQRWCAASRHAYERSGDQDT
jgi:hypothetical protein